ncbi:UNVERIFIED_CONTAM: hypothetical protein FKN15_053210 [Acipenser sinensis]
MLPPDVSSALAYETVKPRPRPSFLADIVETDSVHKMTEWENAPAAVAESPEIKLFGKWSTDDVQINDISLQMLCSCRKRLLDCAAERSSVLDLFPNSFADWTRSHSCSPTSPPPSPPPSPSPSQSREHLKASPATPCTPECQEALQAARTACLQSRALCREVKEAVDQAVSLGRAAHKATNDGLTQKIAETVNLTQHLQVSSGESRVAIQRVQRWYDENEHSEGRVLGPVSSADLLTRERLDRPQVQVYQRHAGTQLPEATAIVQGYAALRQSLLNTSQDLGLLHRTRLQLEENMQGKRAAAGLDSAITRLRRRNSDHRWTDYIACKEKYAKYLPHSGGRYAAKRFRKAQCPIVERLTNSMMMHGRNNGKKLLTCRIVKHAFEIIHLLTGENPLQVLVNAIINSGPREDSTRIGRAGTVRRQAVDVSPLRRVNQAIWLLCTGAREAAFRNIKTIAECLADELINAAKGSSNSYAIKKKDELERVAKSNR